MRWVRLVIGLLAVLALGACTPAPPGTPAATSAVPEPAIAAGTTGTVELADRPFGLHVPTGYDRSKPAPLIVALHGFTSTASEAFSFFGLDEAADARGLLVALPDGTRNPRGEQFWNASSACCNFYGSSVDDSGYLRQVIEAVQQGYAVDPRRVFVVGHSNGGFMALRLACDNADQVAAVASVAGAMDVDVTCAPARPVSVLQVHGDADDTILFKGGSIEGSQYTSAVATTDLWRDRDACPAGDGATGAKLDADARVDGDDLTPTAWAGCAQDTEVALWRIADASHVPSLTADFTNALVDWFEANARD